MKRQSTLNRTAMFLLAVVAMALTSLSASAEYVKLTALSGSNDVNAGEGCGKLVDGIYTSKWGQSTNFDAEPAEDDKTNGRRWVIVKADKAFTPENYFLITGNDTNGDQARNWKNWTISGANFEKDEDATRDASAWTVIDKREDAFVSVANFGSTNFKMNDEETLANYDGTPYKYYMIEVTAMKEPGDHYMQMSEFGFGTSDEFYTWVEIQAADVTKPITYSILDGDRNNADGEALSKLFDGQKDTKWGNGFNAKSFGSTSGGAFFIVKTSRAIAPSYYKLVTGTDNESWNHRNWKSWQIYGIAAADVTNGKPERASDKWVMLDRKDNISEEILPDKNMYTVIFNLSEENAEKYQYFKVEIDEIMSGSGYMQMSEFSLGDEHTLAIDRDAILDEFSYDPNSFAEKALLDNLGQTVDEIKNCNDPVALDGLSKTLGTQWDQLAVSIENYAELVSVRNQTIARLTDDNLTDAATAYMNVWVSETEMQAPNSDYPAGNFAYIKANRQLTGAEAVAEAKRVNEYILANLKVEDDPIYAVYETIIDGNGFNDGEMAHSLIDGDPTNTKWCANTGHKPWRLVFKSNEPIQPTYYGLVTGNDTQSNPSRNWKTWKIWAANFDSDEDVTEDSDKWVLIDEKTNVGSDVLKPLNIYESYLNFSVGCAVPYQYFKIVIESSGGDLIQMNELSFYNYANLNEYREQFVDEVYMAMEDAGVSIDESTVAYKPYLDELNDKLSQLKSTLDAPLLMSLKNRLVELVGEIAESVSNYEEYRAVVDAFDPGIFADYEQAAAWAEGYANDNVAPGAVYLRGTSEYILTNMQLTNSELQDEIRYINSMMAAAEDPETAGYIVLGGHTVSGWGDGHYSQIVDNIVREPVLDGNGEHVKNAYGEYMYATKWGGYASSLGDTYVIFRTIDAVNPYFYTLTTGGDTYTYQGRNWKTWEIYGANFEGDGEATKDAEGWVLVDRKENVGQNRLHPESMTASYFGFSTETTVPYTYYKVVVYAAFSGNQIQMQELRFGTEEEFEEIKQDYTDQANEFDYNVLAQKALIDKYEGLIEDISEAVNMEVLFRIHDSLDTLRTAITESAAQYKAFQNIVETNKAYLEENALTESEFLTLFNSYLTDIVEPSDDVFPNGSAAYIIDEHVLADSALVKEQSFMESLKAAAVAAGYGKGMDISAIIVNRTMSEKAQDHVGGGIELTGWNGVAYRTATNVDADGNSMSSAEFCNAPAATYDINQTLTNLLNGYYKVTLNAAFRPNGDINSFNYNAYAYANDTKSFIPAVREYMTNGEEGAWINSGNAFPDKPIYACDVDPSLEEDSTIVGYVVWGCEGSNNAFLNGRYAMTLVAKVTDGTLKIGLANDGTTNGGDWTCAGNFGLVYLGTEEADAADALKLAADCNDARADILEAYEPVSAFETMGDYKKAPGFAAAEKAILAANKGKATYEAVEAISAVVKSIGDTKKAYTALVGIKDAVNEKWINVAYNSDAEEQVYSIVELLSEGQYENAEAATKAGDDLVAQFPDYLGVSTENANLVVDMTDDSFGYTVIADAVRNPMIILGGSNGYGLYNGIDKKVVKEATLTFDYTSSAALNSKFYIGKDADDTKMVNKALEAATAPAPVTIDVTEAVKEWDFFASANDLVRWQLASGECNATVTISNVRINVTIADTVTGDVNGDGAVTIQDVVAVLEMMAADSTDLVGDVNGDGAVTIQDVVAILEIMVAN